MIHPTNIITVLRNSSVKNGRQPVNRKESDKQVYGDLII